MMCCLVWVNLWFFILVGKCLLLLNRLFMVINIRFGENIISLVLCSGFRWIRFRLVGIGRLWVNLWYGWMWMVLMVIFGLWCSRLNSFIWKWRVKCLLMIFSVCKCLCIICCWVFGLYGWMLFLLLILVVGLFLILLLLFNSVLILVWERILLFMLLL